MRQRSGCYAGRNADRLNRTQSDTWEIPPLLRRRACCVDNLVDRHGRYLYQQNLCDL
jgi:hypothetical protein